jgi:excisionase family DNA binding protein
MQEEFDDIENEFYDPSPPDQEVMTVTEVMEALGISRATLHNWRKRGLLVAYQIGFSRKVRFKRAEVMAFAAQAAELTRI